MIVKKPTTLKEQIITTPKTKALPKPKKVEKQRFWKFQRFVFGIGKEFERITWTSKKELFYSFVVVLLVVGFFALFFTLITILIVMI